MANSEFPRTAVGGVPMPRMIIGTNWILGYSHKGPAQQSGGCRNRGKGSLIRERRN